MTKWEYKIVSFRTVTFRQQAAMKEWTKKLNELGKQGWELVGAAPMGLAGATTQVGCFLKRRKK